MEVKESAFVSHLAACRGCEKRKAVLSSVCFICIVQGDGAVTRKAVLCAAFHTANAFTWAAIKNKARVQICKEKS